MLSVFLLAISLAQAQTRAHHQVPTIHIEGVPQRPGVVLLIDARLRPSLPVIHEAAPSLVPRIAKATEVAPF